MTMGELPLTSEVQFLASTQNRKELCYEYEATALQPDTSDEDQVAPPVDATAPSRADPPPVSISHPVPVAAASIADVSVSGEEIVRALVAQKLKKPIEQILTSKSIKELSGGKWAFIREPLHIKGRTLITEKGNPLYRTSSWAILMMSSAPYLKQQKTCL